MSAVVNGTGTFPLVLANFGNRQPPCQFEFSAQNLPLSEQCFLEVTRLDTENRIASGRFAFFLVDDICGDTLFFTDGRFDKKF